MEKIYLLALPLAGVLACAPPGTGMAGALAQQAPLLLDSGTVSEDSGAGPNTSCWGTTGCPDGGPSCPLSAGTPCADPNNLCNIGTCDGNGTCAITTTTSCSPDGGYNPCLACNGLGGCIDNNGVACQDNSTCMTGTCTQGTCDAGTPMCIPGQCQTYTGCQGNGICGFSNKSPGTSCTNSGDPCNSYSCDSNGGCVASTSLCPSSTCRTFAFCNMACAGDAGCDPCNYNYEPQTTSCQLQGGDAGFCDGNGRCVAADAGSDAGTGPGTDAGTGPGTDAGTGPGTDAGTGPGTDAGHTDGGPTGSPGVINPFGCGCGSGPGAPVLLALGLLAAFLGRRRREGRERA